MEGSEKKPSEQRGGTTPDEAEAREKGEWGATAAEGIVPAEQGGSDAPRETLGEDPELEARSSAARPGRTSRPPRRASIPAAATRPTP